MEGADSKAKTDLEAAFPQTKLVADHLNTLLNAELASVAGASNANIDAMLNQGDLTDAAFKTVSDAIKGKFTAAG